MTGFADIWAAIDGDGRRESPGWMTRRIRDTDSCALFAALAQPGGEPAFLLEVPARAVPPSAEYPQAIGFRTFPETVSPGPRGMVRLCVLLTNPEHQDLFERVADDVAEFVAKAPDCSRGVRAFLARLHVWQMFFRARGAELGEEAERGLFGELHFLQVHLLGKLTARDALASWRGPQNGLHDFVLDDCRLEVKTTSPSGNGAIHVSNLAQLDERGGGPLLLYRLALGKSATGTSLPDLVGRVLSTLRDEDPSSVGQFIELLMRAGYHGVHAKRYVTKFMPGAEAFYEVKGEFPRIRTGDMHEGIREASYLISLEACEPYTISTVTAQALMYGHEAQHGP